MEEAKIDENTYEVHNKGNFDTDYSVLRFEFVPHKCLKDFKCVHVPAGKKVTVSF